MEKRWHTMTFGILVLILCIMVPASESMAADFALAWDEHPDTENITGFKLYYKEGSSVVEDSTGAESVEIEKDADGFDSTDPSYELTGLDDDVTYYFAVSAYDATSESEMSNEVSGMNGESVQTDDPGSPSSGGSSGGGCFLTMLRQ